MSQPVFAFLALTGGSYEGAIIRDLRLANALHRRGHKVVVYWLMKTNAKLLDASVPQRLVCRAARYLRKRPNTLLERLSVAAEVFGDLGQHHFVQRRPWLVTGPLRNFIVNLCDGWTDREVLERLERMMQIDGVTHVLPTFALLGPMLLALRQRGKVRFQFLPTFQGEEIFANFAQQAGRMKDYTALLQRSSVEGDWPAVVVSDDYGRRLHEEFGIDPKRMKTIYPGIDLPAPGYKPPVSALSDRMRPLDPKTPIVTYLGRHDSEKGIDLLLYAAKILREQGLKFQLVICGTSSFGLNYGVVCREIARHLRLDVVWKRRISDEVRSALYAYSRFVVYPSIHREPFGMVAAETMSFGTPVIVPDHGGITEVIGRDGRVGGLTFKVWDTADLARQMHRLLTDDQLHAQLSANTRQIAAAFSVDALADRVLEHLGVKK